MAVGTLQVVATPIGNLEDITLRALRVLGECDAVVAEDSRRTRALLTANGISKEIVSLPAFDENRRVPLILKRLDLGQTLALCTDAGTPTVSDPGAVLVGAARESGHKVEVIPGVSALTAGLSGSGVRAGTFVFLGFLPRSSGKLRRSVGGALAGDHTVVFFESALRIARTLRTLVETVGDREVIVARELTKVHETFHRGSCEELAAAFTEKPPRGECTVIVSGDSQ